MQQPKLGKFARIVPDFSHEPAATPIRQIAALLQQDLMQAFHPGLQLKIRRDLQAGRRPIGVQDVLLPAHS